METKKIIVVLIAIIYMAQTQAQKIYEEPKGCFLMQGNIAGSYLFKQKKALAYFGGDAQYFVQNYLSVGGDVWLSIRLKDNTNDGIRDLHSVFWGVNYHPAKKGRFDPYIGLSPGVAYVNIGYHDAENIYKKTSGIAPLVSATAEPSELIFYTWSDLYSKFIKRFYTANIQRKGGS